MKNIKRAGSYPLLAVLILQLALTSLLCAVSSYAQAGSSMVICTSFGIKTITINEDGIPVEETAPHAFGEKQCFHCSSGCNGINISSNISDFSIQIPAPQYLMAKTELVTNSHQSRAPPPRGPPHTV